MVESVDDVLGLVDPCVLHDLVCGVGVCNDEERDGEGPEIEIEHVLLREEARDREC